MAGPHVSDAELREMLNVLRKDAVAFNLVNNYIKTGKMHKIVERLHWNIGFQSVDDVRKVTDKYNEEGDKDVVAIPLTEEEWNIIVHPSGDWCLYMTFDEKSLQEDESNAYERIRSFMSLENKKHLKNSHVQTELTIRRGERFTCTTTLREVLERIKEGLVYGYYEGIIPTVQNHFLYSENFDNMPIYKLQTGT